MHQVVSAHPQARRHNRRTVPSGQRVVSTIGSEWHDWQYGFACFDRRGPLLRESVYPAATLRREHRSLGRLADGGAYPAVRPMLSATTPCCCPLQKYWKRLHQAAPSLVDRIEAASGRGSSSSWPARHLLRDYSGELGLRMRRCGGGGLRCPTPSKCCVLRSTLTLSGSPPAHPCDGVGTSIESEPAFCLAFVGDSRRRIDYRATSRHSVGKDDEFHSADAG